MRPAMGIFLLLVGIVLIGAAYVLHVPAPTAFAGKQHVRIADYHDQDPSGVPAELKAASAVERGEYLTRAADCAACHTAQDGTPFTGGRAFVLPFGTLYSTNITPDAQTGIGAYSDADFLNAVHKGIGRNGTKLYPAMPFTSYTYMSDADVLAIKAYLLTLAPVHAPAPANTLAFPFNQRALMGMWAAIFNPDERFEPHTDKSAQWNRGAYLAEAMGHCGECHTPRNLAFAVNNSRKFAGAVQAGWRAYNITSDPHAGIGSWSDADLAHYLSIGHADGRGTATGPMGDAVENSLKYLKASDVDALVTYLRSVPGISSSDAPQLRTTPADDARVAAGTTADHGALVFEGNCAGCHGNTGVSPVLPYATLTGTRSINDPSGNNVAQVIIHGGQRHYAHDANNMPGFGETYSDEEIAAVANYVTARFGTKGSTLTAADVAKLRTLD
jgi:mono/diheme cytochrome c family protein